MAKKTKSTGSKNKKIRNLALDVIMVCLALLVVISGWRVFTMIREYKAGRDSYQEVMDQSGGGYLGNIDFNMLKKINPDVVGWLYYENAGIDYPVVQGEDNDKYLNIMFDGNWGICGTLFVDCITEKPFEQFNTIIYGHHMRDGTMFAGFEELKDPEYCKEHPRLELITPDEKYHLDIWAFLNQPSDSEIYTTNITDPEQQEKYLELAEKLASYTTDVTVEPGDKLVLLSTCAYEYQDARYIVVCKMVPWEE